MTERDDLLDTLHKHRDLFRFTVNGLSDEHARTRSTVSELTLGGLVKHVATTEQEWADFVVNGPTPYPDIDWSAIDWSDPPPAAAAYRDGFRMTEDDTLEDLLRRYDDIAAATDQLLMTVDLDESHPLPEAPWNPPGASWTNRRVFVHLVAETAQHAGHADFLREAIDGQKSMG